MFFIRIRVALAKFILGSIGLIHHTRITTSNTGIDIEPTTKFLFLGECVLGGDGPRR